MYQDAPFAWSADYLRLPAPTVDQPTGRSIVRPLACPPASDSLLRDDMTAPQVRTGCPSFERDAEVTRPSR
jgi:hypothetical protein